VRHLHSLPPAAAAERKKIVCLGGKSAAAVEFGMPAQLQHLSSPPPPGAKEDLSDSEKEEEEEVKGEQAGCYTNGSFFLESRNKLTRWLSQTDMVEEVEKGSCGTISTTGELKRRGAGRRLVEKGGNIRVRQVGLPDQRLHYLRDIFTTAVDLRWRYTFFLFAAAFFLSWLGFAAIWHLTFWLHGDLEPENLDNEKYKPCVYEIHDFTSTFLFSVETQHTIGYGSRGSTNECWDTVVLQCIQSIVGVIIQASMAGIVFAKLSRPKRRAATIIFSEKAVISCRNGLLRLMCRVGNVRSSQLLESHFSGILLGHVTTQEGEVLRYHQTRLDLSVEVDTEDSEPRDYGHLLLPVVVSHTILPNSPLYNIGPHQLLHSKLEIVIVLEGVVEPSGNTTQVRTSYLPEEIMWGHHFRNCVNFVKSEGLFVVDLSRVSSVIADTTLRLSAAQLKAGEKEGDHASATNASAQHVPTERSAGGERSMGGSLTSGLPLQMIDDV